MVNLAPNYYPAFLGNGLDAVLIGYSGSMVEEKTGVDWCFWYKSDRYYPEEKLLQVAGRWPAGKALEHVDGSGWYELAPLGRTWYQVQLDGKPLTILGSQQHFVPQEGTLYSDVDYGAASVKVTTFLHARRSLLIEHFEFDRQVDLRAWMGPGVWVEDGWHCDPFLSIEMEARVAQGRYDLGETQGQLALRLDPQPLAAGASGQDRWVQAGGKVFTKYFSINDSRQGPLSLDEIEQAAGLGYTALRQEHLEYWRDYFTVSNISIPDEQFQAFYDFSQYMFKAMQNPISGGLPVNNLRRTWSSHIFWDAYFIQRAMLEAGHRTEALEAVRFLQRTQAAARRHAREEFGVEGLKWDWEITHQGKKAYGALVHMKDQVHNNASYANMIWQYYQFTLDREMLGEFYPLLEGMARYFLADVVEETAQGYGTRPVVGVSENPIRVRDEGMTVAGTITILRRTAEAARLLELESGLVERCLEVSQALLPRLYQLYNGRYFIPQEDRPQQVSLAPIYPMQVVGFKDERSLSTTLAYFEQYKGRMVGHGGNMRGFPWSAGVLATVFARQGRGDLAWQVIDGTRAAICQFGGMTEVMEDGGWNMQYFGTAQGAVCSALHNLLLQDCGEEVLLFPAVPQAWEQCAFDGLLAGGLAVSASFNRLAGEVSGTLRSLAPCRLERRLNPACLGPGQDVQDISLEPGESYDFHWKG